MEVGNWTEGVQVDFELSCRRHVRRCTPNAVRDKKQLLCPLCSSAAVLKRAKKRGLSQPERNACALLFDLRQAREWRWQVCPPLKSGKQWVFDFMHAGTGILYEVDGKQHCVGGMHGVPAAEQQRRDIEKMRDVWVSGGLFVRMHHADLGAGGARTAILHAFAHKEAGSTGPLVVFSPSYNPTVAVTKDEVLHPWYFITELETYFIQSMRVTASDGCILFKRSPSLTV